MTLSKKSTLLSEECSPGWYHFCTAGSALQHFSITSVGELSRWSLQNKGKLQIVREYKTSRIPQHQLLDMF